MSDLASQPIERRWYDYKGFIVELDADAPLTMYNGLNHQIVVWEGGALGQMLTKCGKRACPTPGTGLREVPGRGPVDCPTCLEEINLDQSWTRDWDCPEDSAYDHM